MRILTVIALLFVAIAAFAQKTDLDTIATIPKELIEISGMERHQSGVVWAINDSGNDPIVYQLNVAGHVVKQTWITGATNQDWEELALDDNGNLYIGDFGNNRNSRKDLVVYVVQTADLYEKDTAQAQRIDYTYENQTQFPPPAATQNFDVEAMVYYNNRLILFSKNRTKPFTGYSTLYQLPTVPGTYQAKKIDSLFLGSGPRELYQLTAAAISPDGKRMVLMSYDKFFLIHDLPYDDLIGGRVEMVEFAEVSQKEAVVWNTDSTILLSDEKSVLGGGNLYGLDLAPHIKNNSRVRRQEVNIPNKEFRDSLLVQFETELRGPVYYEFYSGEGDRVRYGKIGDFDRGKHEFKLTPDLIANGVYMLNIQIGSRPHAFFVYRFKPVDWDKVKKEFEDVKGQR